MLVGQLRSTVAGDDIAIGSVADRCLLSGRFCCKSRLRPIDVRQHSAWGDRLICRPLRWLRNCDVTRHTEP